MWRDLFRSFVRNWNEPNVPSCTWSDLVGPLAEHPKHPHNPSPHVIDVSGQNSLDQGEAETVQQLDKPPVVLACRGGQYGVPFMVKPG
jgi:hypothetical protein